jgi:glycosyltransferase involved in cell wall biosynthesis
MRVLHLVNRIDEAGDGITNVSVDLAVQQRRSGHDVTLGAQGGSYESLLDEYGVDFVRLNFADRRLRSVRRTRQALRALVRRSRPDVIHVHTLTTTLVAVSLVGGPPVVATVHNEYQRGVGLMGLADAVVGVSHAVTEAMVSRRVPRRRTWTVLNGTIGSPRRVDVGSLPLPEVSRPAVVTVGAVSHRKGVDIVLDAFGRLLGEVPNAHLYFVGHPDWTEFVEGARQRPYADHVHFEGFVPQPQAYLACADVFVLASRRDPFPLVLLEALEAGCAIVGSTADGIPEALGNGEAGLLSPVGDAVALAGCLQEVLTDPELAAGLRRSALDAARNFTVQRMSEDYLHLYRRLISVGGPPRRSPEQENGGRRR